MLRLQRVEKVRWMEVRGQTDGEVGKKAGYRIAFRLLP